MEKEGSKGREVRKLGAASILLDLAPESETVLRSRRLSKDLPPRYLESNSVLQYPKDSRTRLNRISKRGMHHEGHLVVSTIGGIGVDSMVIGGGVANKGTREGIIFAESPITPGIPVVYRTAEERIANPDRLNLDRRHLTVCPILEGEEQLRLLNLQHNAITRLQHLGSLRRLVFLDLYDNLVTDITGLDGLYSLRVLMLGRNRIHNISGLGSLSRLDVLDLHGNMIREISNLNHLCHLRVLNLAGNDITVLKGVSGLIALSELNLRRNRITQCDEIDTPCLQRLYLSHNLIQSADDIICLSSCKILIDLSIDGNPLSNSPDYRIMLLSQFNQLATLNQTTVTDLEREEGIKIAEKEDRISQELSRKSIQLEEKLVTLETVKKEWKEWNESNDTENITRSSSYFIDVDNGSLSIYGVKAITHVIHSNDLSTVTSLTIDYIDFNELYSSLLILMKEKMTNLKSLTLGHVNMASLVQLQQLSVSLPNSVTSVTIIEEGGANPVTDHTLFEQWVCHVFPSHVDVNNTRRGEGEGEENNLFEPLDRLQSLCANPSFKHHNIIDPYYQQTAGAVADELLQATLTNYRKQQLFERVWPNLIDSLVKETIDWTCSVLDD